MTFAELIIRFGTSGADGAERAIRGLGKAFDDVTAKAMSFKDVVAAITTGNLLSSAIGGIANNFLDLGKSILSAGMSAETTNARFAALGMNAEKTRAFLTKVASSSSMTTNQLTEMAMSLQLGGFNIQRVLPAFARLADLVGTDSDKLQGMVRLLNVLKTGARPDQELLQSLKMPTLLAEAGLKFDKGRLVGDIKTAMESVVSVIESYGSKVSEKLGATFEASWSSMKDQFDKIKEQLGMKILEWAKPWVDALTKVLSAMVDSGAWKLALDQFFNNGAAMNKKMADGITSPEGLKTLIPFIAKIVSSIAVIPAQLEVLFKNVVPLVKNALDKLSQDPRVQGMLKVLEAIGKAFPQQTDTGKVASRLFKEGKISDVTARQVQGLPNFGKIAPNEELMLVEYERRKLRNAANAPVSNFQSQMTEINKRQNDLQYSMTQRMLGILNKPNVLDKGVGAVTMPGASLGDQTSIGGRAENKKSIKEAKEQREKQVNALEQIRDHTKTTAEMSLREFTYGGGVLGANAVSKIDLHNRNAIYSPSTTGLSYLEKGFQQVSRAFVSNNHLNLNQSRS